jgi:lipopolysaccharide biosynthesis glycosyltransferase
MNIVFSSDRGMLAALHVAAKSVLEHFQGVPSFMILSDELGEADIDLLRETLLATGKNFQLELRNVDSGAFRDFPSLAGRHSTYFRLLIPDISQAERCLYLDCDTLCFVDLSLLANFDLNGNSLALAPEAPIQCCLDRKLVDDLGARASGFYYNAGFCVMDCDRWRRENLAKKCLEYVTESQPDYHDQSALNFIFHNQIANLPLKYNRHSNVRTNWPFLCDSRKRNEQLIHFVDYPKPWSSLGRWVHPFGKIWWAEYRKTAHFHAGGFKPQKVAWNAKVRAGYKKALKDRILFGLYRAGLFTPKGVPTNCPSNT